MIPLSVAAVALFWLAISASQTEQEMRLDVTPDEGWKERGLFGLFTAVPWLGLLRKPVRSTAAAVTSRFAGAKLPALTGWFNGLTHATRSADAAHVGVAAATADALDYQGRVIIPGVRRAADRANDRAGLALGGVKRTDRALHRFREAQARTDARQGHRIDSAGARAKAASRSASRANVKARAATGRATAAQRTANQALTRTKAAAFAGTLAAVMVGRLGFRWWRCSSFRGFGRNLRCSHWSFLQDLLFLPLTALLVTDACRLSDAVNQAAGIMDQTVMRPLVGVTDNICRSGGGAMPSASDPGGYSGSWLPTAV